MALDNSCMELCLQEWPDSQHHGILLDHSVLRVPGVWQSVRRGVRPEQQRVLRQLPVSLAPLDLRWLELH
jgi:hypothetical protein